MPFTADAFLEALDLPSEHPYIWPQDNVHEVEREAWTQNAQSPSSQSKGCGDFPTRFSNKWNPDLHGDEDVCSQNEPSLSVATSSSSTADFLHEIEPCLLSMFHLNILLAAPLVLVFCLKKLYHAEKHDPSECQFHQLDPELLSEKKESIQKSSYFVAILSYMPSLRNATMAHDEQKRQTPEPYHQNNNSFERLLLWLSLFSNIVSISSFFSERKDRKMLDESENEYQDVTNNRFRKLCGTRSVSNDATEEPFVFTSEWLAYVVALFFTAVLMNDAMYVLEYQQSNLIAFHLFVISWSCGRFGSKVSFATALPISAIAFWLMACQDLDLPTIEPGLYYDESNPFISNVVKDWPADKRTYDDGRGTPWMITGDTRTGLPFMVNNNPEQKYVRKLVDVV